MYDIATYTHANVEKMANSQVRLDARSDYSLQFRTYLSSVLNLVLEDEKNKKSGVFILEFWHLTSNTIAAPYSPRLKPKPQSSLCWSQVSQDISQVMTHDHLMMMPRKWEWSTTTLYVLRVRRVWSLVRCLPMTLHV